MASSYLIILCKKNKTCGDLLLSYHHHPFWTREQSSRPSALRTERAKQYFIKSLFHLFILQNEKSPSKIWSSHHRMCDPEVDNICGCTQKKPTLQNPELTQSCWAVTRTWRELYTSPDSASCSA